MVGKTAGGLATSGKGVGLFVDRVGLRGYAFEYY